MTQFQPRFLACLPKDIEPHQESERVERAQRLILQKLDVHVDVVTSGHWYKETFINSGNFAGWIYESVHGRSSMTASPHFVGFVVFNRTIGKATAEIVEQALSAQRAVLLIDDEEMSPITNVTRNDNESWSMGWTVHTKETLQ
jgi:hypothetical protein